MDYRKIAESIKNRIEKTHDREAYKDLLALCIGYEAEDFAAAHQLNSEVRKMTSEALRNGNPKDAEYFYTLHKQSMLFDAPHDFDTFLLYVEMDRKPEKRFYAPRRRYLRPIVQGYQDVLDGKLRLLTISLPKRAGKSQLGINFINMISGRNPDKSSLMEGTGDDLVRSFYLASPIMRPPDPAKLLPWPLSAPCLRRSTPCISRAEHGPKSRTRAAASSARP